MFGLTCLVEEGTLPGPSLHGEGEGGKRSGARVDLGAVEVVGEDQPRDVGRGVALFLVDGVEQVERVGEHVAGATGGVDDFDLLGLGDLEEVGLVVDRGDVVGHLLAQMRAGAVEQPEATKRVLDEVADDPVRSEELGGGGESSAARPSCSS